MSRSLHSLLIALCAGVLIGGHGPRAHARQVFQTPARQAIAQAEVVAIAVVEQVSERRGKCEDLVRYTLRPVEALRGALSAKIKRVEFVAATLKAAPGCISASYSHPPRARTPKKGARLVITIKYNPVLKAYRAFSTHELRELPAIRRWLAAPPTPTGKPAVQPAKKPAAKKPAAKKPAARKPSTRPKR